MNRTDNKRQQREIEKTYTNHPSTVTATPRRLNESVLQEVKPGLSDMYAVVEKELGYQLCQSAMPDKTWPATPFQALN